MIEDAWKEGFDPQGASQLNNRLQGTKAWIGACEVYTLLTSLRVKYVPKNSSSCYCHIWKVLLFLSETVKN